MAAINRNERQLMRQRGAGLRNVNNVDFGLNIESHGSRDERQLMRQRGAGNRKVDNIDFGFSFPTPNASRRSVSKTPRTGQRKSGRISRTPLRASREPSAARSIRQTSVGFDQPPSEQRRSSRTPKALTNSESQSNKRRKLDPEVAELSMPQSALSSRNSGAVFAIAEEDELAVDATSSNRPDTVRPETRRTLDSSLSVSGHDDKENENAEAQQKRSAPKRRKRKPVVQHIGRKKKRTSTNSANESIIMSVERDDVEPTEEADIRPNAADENEHSVLAATPLPQSPALSPVSSQQEEVLDNAKTQGQKRKSIGPVTTKQLYPDDDPAVDEHTLPTPETTQEPNPPEASDGELSATDDWNEQDLNQSRPSQQARSWVPGQLMARARLAAQQRRARMSVSTSPAPRDAAEPEGDETYVEEDHTPEPPTPAPRKKSRRRPNNTTSGTAGGEQRQKSRGATFPILTHRMTNIHALPTITESNENHDNSDDEPDPLSAIFVDRAAPNAIDVLAQICRETVETAIEKAASQASGRAKLKRKRAALETFSHDLDQRLFEMSSAVEHRLTLEARLRKSKREKSDLQSRWMELRHQRDELALKSDEIRRANWEAEEESKRQNEISELAYKTELELERESRPEVDGLEFLLRSVAARVSCKGNGGGLLERIKGFNEMLERVALGLEGR